MGIPKKADVLAGKMETRSKVTEKIDCAGSCELCPFGKILSLRLEQVLYRLNLVHVDLVQNYRLWPCVNGSAFREGKNPREVFSEQTKWSEACYVTEKSV